MINPANKGRAASNSGSWFFYRLALAFWKEDFSGRDDPRRAVAYDPENSRRPGFAAPGRGVCDDAKEEMKDLTLRPERS